MRLIDADSLIERILEHEACVVEEKKTTVGSVYLMAHRHIIQLIELEPTIEVNSNEMPTLQEQENKGD